jgi:hypothetical protein
MKRVVLSLLCLVLNSFTFYAASEMTKYEVSDAKKSAHEEIFYEKSYKYEDALRSLQIVLIVDKSGSQQAPDQHPVTDTPSVGMIEGSGWTQWDNTFFAAKYLAESIFEYDADGKVPLIFFGHQANDKEVKSIGEMLVSFKKNKPTNETTNLVSALRLAFEKYSTPTKEGEKILFIVLTDGSPNPGQEGEVKSLIASNIKKDEALNLLFVRIGDDPGAKRFLSDLDDCKEVGEVVDTKSDNMMHKMGPKNLILNAIYEHLDSQYVED